MADLTKYLQAKLQKTPTKANKIQALEQSSERLCKSMEFTPKEEQDYSPNSEFWKHANVPDEQKSPIRLRDSLRFSGMEKEIDNKSTVSELLKKFKTHTPSEIVTGLKLSDTSILMHHDLEKKLGEVAGLVENFEIHVRDDMARIEGHIIGDLREGLSEVAKDINLNADERHDRQLETLNRVAVHIDKMHPTEDINSSIKMLLKDIKQNDKPVHDKLDKMMEELQREIKGIHVNTSTTTGGIDRPTRNLISGMNDKLIQLTKLSQHEFTATEQRWLKIDKKLSNLENLPASIERIQLNQMHPRQVSTNSFDSSSKSSTDEVIMEHYGHIYSELLHLKVRVENDQKLDQERMKQFMNIFSILQDAHTKLIDQQENLKLKDEVKELKSVVGELKKQNEEIIRLLRNR